MIFHRTTLLSAVQGGADCYLEKKFPVTRHERKSPLSQNSVLRIRPEGVSSSSNLLNLFV